MQYSYDWGRMKMMYWPHISQASYGVSVFNSSPPGQDGHHFAAYIYRCIFVNEKFSVLIKISLKFVPKGLIDSNPELV